MKALFAVPGIAAELDPIALDQIFTFWFPLAPRTPFRGVARAAAGASARRRRRGRHVRPLLAARISRCRRCRRASTAATRREIAEELRALLLDATRIRLRADVPVGAYLSGGLDSSIIAAAVHRLVPERLRTFSVTFESAEFDESAVAARDGAGARHRPQRDPLPRRRYRPHLPRGHPPRRAARSCAPRRRRSSRSSEARPRQRLQGRADRRGRRRGLRRLRHLQGSASSAASARAPAAARKRPAAPLPAPLPLPSGACRASRQSYREAFFADRPRRARRSALLASAALPHDRRRQAVLLGRDARGACRL